MTTDGRKREAVATVIRLSIFGVTVGLFVLSCSLPAFQIDKDPASGWWTVSHMWSGLTIVPWLANICLFLGLTTWLLGKEWPTLLWSSLALILSLSSWLF